jgi:sec-independent protein translocase protein TatB
MFDIGFSEMLVIAVVALIVIGPERLPGVARTMGHLFGRMQRYVNDVKSDIQREIELDELRKLRDTVESSAREIEQSVSRDFQAVEQEMHDLQALANPASEPEQRPAAAAVAGERQEQAAAGTPANEAPAGQPSSSTASPPPVVPATSGERPRQA